jgi:hypothetical protein
MFWFFALATETWIPVSIRMLIKNINSFSLPDKENRSVSGGRNRKTHDMLFTKGD